MAQRQVSVGVGIAIGVAIGVAIGAAVGQIGPCLVIGSGIGLLVGTGMDNRTAEGAVGDPSQKK